MREDHEELILHNPAFVSCVLWNLARAFADHSGGRSPDLSHMVIGTSMLFHAATVEKIHGMRFESGLLKAVSDVPELIAGVQSRLEMAMPACLLALQVGVSANIFRREGGEGLPVFLALGTNLPRGLRENGSSTASITQAARRLGAWLAQEDLATVRGRMGVRF